MDIKSVYNDNKPTGGNGLFLKLESGQTVRLRFLGLPVVFDSEYQGKTSTKYAWLVYNHDESKTQIYQAGSTIYNGLNDLIQDSDWGDPKDYDVKVTRTGTGKETKYAIVASPKSLPLPETMEDVDILSIMKKSPYNENVHLLGQMFTPAEEVVIEDIEDKPIDLSTIPFNKDRKSL